MIFGGSFHALKVFLSSWPQLPYNAKAIRSRRGQVIQGLESRHYLPKWTYTLSELFFFVRCIK